MYFNLNQTMHFNFAYTALLFIKVYYSLLYQTLSNISFLTLLKAIDFNYLQIIQFLKFLNLLINLIMCNLYH